MARVVAEGDRDRVRNRRDGPGGPARKGAFSTTDSGQPKRAEGNSPRSRRDTFTALWRATMHTHADRLVRRRTFRVVHVRRVVSGDIGHLGPSTLWGPQTASSCTDRVRRESRNVLPGRSMDRVYDRRDRPAKRLRSAISSRRWKASDFAEWRTESALAGRWQRVVLSGRGWGHDSGADRPDREFPGRVAKDAFSG